MPWQPEVGPVASYARMLDVSHYIRFSTVWLLPFTLL